VRQLRSAGWAPVNFEDSANLYIINTCSVTEFADKKCRQIVRKALRNNPQAKVIVTGCYAQLQPDEIANIDGVDLVLGASEKFRLIDYVNELSLINEKALIKVGDIDQETAFSQAHSLGGRTRAFLKVQDGCDYKCSFCTIPKARGKSRSGSIDQLVRESNQLHEKGIKEIVLTGVNIGDFGVGTSTNFLDLIKALDRDTQISRYRISSIEPNLLIDGIVSFVAKSKRFMPHFHIPLQSGNNKQLKMMRRRYTKELYLNRINTIRSILPDACIGVDVIVGFPGETDLDFEQSFNFIHEMEVSYLHVFTYSARPGTLAANMPNQVNMESRKARNERLRLLSVKKRHLYYKSFLGDERVVLFENGRDNKELQGFTDNYIKVSTSYQAGLVNKLHSVKLNRINEDGSVGININLKQFT
jgi:threonylcarbamoyladenosine tRNA methylthiotransferase MtaB